MGSSSIVVVYTYTYKVIFLKARLNYSTSSVKTFYACAFWTLTQAINKSRLAPMCMEFSTETSNVCRVLVGSGLCIWSFEAHHCPATSRTSSVNRQRTCWIEPRGRYTERLPPNLLRILKWNVVRRSSRRRWAAMTYVVTIISPARHKTAAAVPGPKTPLTGCFLFRLSNWLSIGVARISC